MTNKQVVVWNLIAFSVVYFFIEVILSVETGNTHHNVAVPLFWQYLISWWIIKQKMDKMMKNELIRYTWLVSIGVLLVRILLSVLLVALMFNSI